MSWSSAFLLQARSDLATYELLNQSNAARCQQLHYLQMAGEKLAKAESDEASKNQPPSHTHYGLGKWLKALSARDAHAKRLGFKSGKDFQHAKPSLVETALAIEHLNPKVANDRSLGHVTHTHWTGVGTNVEYPWEEGSSVVVPAEYDFSEAPLSQIRLHRLAKFLDYRIANSLGDATIL